MRFIQGKYGRADHEDMKAFFGLGAKDKWPDEGMEPRLIQQITVWIAPRVPGEFFIRTACACPDCGKTVTVSRLPQHSKVHG